MSAADYTYTLASVWIIEGGRLGAVSCLRCGAALILDERNTEDVLALHDEWHRKLEEKELLR